jgi:L,D-transpeptidase YcbB
VGPKPAEEVAEEAPAEKAPEVKDIKVSSILSSEGEVEIDGIKISKGLLSNIYSKYEGKTIWFTGSEVNANYEKAMKFLGKADENGLSHQYFGLGTIEDRVSDKTGEDEIARTDLLITHLITEMIQQIGNGHKISDELKVQTYFTRPIRVKNVAKAFKEFMEASDFEEVITKYSPKNPQYGLLKVALKNYIESEGDRRTAKRIEYVKDIAVGEKSIVVNQVRRRLGMRSSANPNVDNNVYDKPMLARVVELQRKFKQKPSGIINKEFIESLNDYNINPISRIKANMERYRWLKDDLEPVRLEINLANFKMQAYEESKEAFSMGVISGRSENETPIMSTKMYQVILNPYWHVPKNYFFRSMLPLLKQDPDYVKNQNFDLLLMEKDGWKKIAQSDVKWDEVTEKNYNLLLRQRPGNINVLGTIKFAIDNPYDIYLHSTSEPWLFTNKYRGYSSGCIRVEDPVKLAKFIMEKGEVGLSEEKFMSLYNAYESKDGKPLPQKKEVNDKYYKFKKPIPTYTTYFTVIADDLGNLTFTDDIYDLDLAQSKDLSL